VPPRVARPDPTVTSTGASAIAGHEREILTVGCVALTATWTLCGTYPSSLTRTEYVPAETPPDLVAPLLVVVARPDRVDAHGRARKRRPLGVGDTSSDGSP